MELYVDCVLNKYGKINKIFTYKASGDMCEKIAVGKRVAVPFGKNDRTEIAIIVNVHDFINVKYEIKSILEIIDDRPVIGKKSLDISKFLCYKYLMNYKDALTAVMPPADLKSIKITYKAVGDTNYHSDLYSIIKNNEGIDELSLKKLFDNSSFTNEISKLKVNGLIRTEIILESKVKPKSETYLSIGVEDWRKCLNKRAKKQYQVCELVDEFHCISKKELIINYKMSASAVNALIKTGILTVENRTEYRRVLAKGLNTNQKYKLNDEQRNVYEGILNSDLRYHLIFGATGSGKTEVYLNLAEKTIASGKSVIFTVPEIGLTPMMIERISSRFGDRFAVLHSKLSTGERFDEWRRISNGEVDIVVGVRSAIFAPLSNIGLIVIDEEHDSSYRSLQGLRYDTREVAFFRAYQDNAKVVLGSATPSIESYYNAKRGKYVLWKIKKRAGGALKPSISIADMREELKNGNISIFSRDLIRMLEKNFNDRKQSVLFLNNRGYANFVSCRNCGYIQKCVNCDVSMTYHKDKNLMICHYCGRTCRVSFECPVCKMRYPYIKPFGLGTQMVEEEIKKLLPNAMVKRIDADTMTSKNSYEKEMESIYLGETDVIVGTQMIAKGHDFKNITLSAIIAADSMINFPDYRAAERSFQLITQVIGRSGRGEIKGTAIIQTYNPDNYAIHYAVNGDYEGYYAEEIMIRKNFNYPPFINLIKLQTSSRNYENSQEALKKFTFDLYQYAKKNKIKFEVVGPFPSQISFVNNVFRHYMLIKIDDSNWDKLKNFIKRVYLDNSYNYIKSGVERDIFFNPEGIN